MLSITTDWPWIIDVIIFGGIIVWLLAATFVKWQAVKLERLKFLVYARQKLTVNAPKKLPIKGKNIDVRPS